VTDISVLQTIVSNVSKYTNCFTDFPYSKSAAVFPDAERVQEYLQEHTKHFALARYIQLSTKVLKVARNAGDTKWTIYLGHSDNTTTATDFDKIAVCTGE
jgi:dimethylaniline monooxygenase (N-oxide forming)